MSQWINKFISDHQIAEVSKLVKQAELQTSGEVVPVIIRQSGRYQYLAMYFAFSVLLSLLFIQPSFMHLFYSGFWQLIWLVLFIVFYFIGLLLSRSSWFVRMFVSQAELLKNVEERAEFEFYRHGLMKTDDSTGVLLFVSLLEHKAVILADKGISEKLPKEYWQKTLAQMIPFFKQKDLFSAYKLGINSIGEELKTHFPKRGHDVNELSNHLIILE